MVATHEPTMAIDNSAVKVQSSIQGMTSRRKEDMDRDRRRKELVVAAMLASRRRADRVLDRTALIPAERVWSTQVGRLATGLSRHLKMSLMEPASPAAVVQALAYLRLNIPTITNAIGHVLGETTRQVVTEGFESVAAFMGQVKGATLPLDALHLRNRVISARTVELGRLRRASANHLAQEIHETLHNKLIAITPKQSVGDLVTLANQYLDDEDWKIDRLVRTETSFSYNAAGNDAIGELAVESEFRGLCKRWTELISDLGVPFDNKVAPDSIAMHAQVTKPDGMFTMPEGTNKMMGRSWPHSPNRPHDRSITTPWMKEWNIPGWFYHGYVEAV